MAATVADAERAKEKFDRYEDLIEHLSQNLGKAQQDRMVLRLHKTEVLFEQCLTLAEQFNRPAVFQELYLALDREEPKLLARVKKPKTGMARMVPGLFERKLKKYSKRVDDRINGIHQRLTPLRQRHVPHVPHQQPLTSSHRGTIEETQRQERPIQRTHLATQTSFAQSDAVDVDVGVEEEVLEREGIRERNPMDDDEASVRSEIECDESKEERDIPFQRQDSLLYASTSLQGAASSPSPSVYDHKKKRHDDSGSGLGSTKRALPRSKLKDISNNTKTKGKAAKDPLDRSKKKTTGMERATRSVEVGKEEAEGPDAERRRKATTAIAILLSVCDFLDEDVEQEPYLTYECVEMILNAGELLSKGWNDHGLLKKSFELFKMAALEGSVVAARCVGLFYKTGMSVEGGADLKAARKWFSLGADAGDAISCYMLGDLYEFGLGDEKGASMDIAKASLYYSRFNAKSGSGSGLMVSKLLAESSSSSGAGFNNNQIIKL